MRIEALVVLCAAGASALQYEAAALRRALGAAKPLQDGTVIFRREWREKVGDDAAADAVYDALTRGRGPEVVAAADVVVLNEDVLARVYVDSVAVEAGDVLAVDVGQPRHLDLHVVYVHVAAVDGMEGPEGAVEQRDAGDLHPRHRFTCSITSSAITFWIASWSIRS